MTIRYHSDPYWLDVNSNPEHKNVTATFVDNYSQIAVDFGKTNSGYLKIGTRFNAMDVYLITADTVPEIVKYVFTNLVLVCVIIRTCNTAPPTEPPRAEGMLSAPMLGLLMSADI